MTSLKQNRSSAAIGPKTGADGQLSPLNPHWASQPANCWAVDMGLTDYVTAWRLQGRLVTARRQGAVAEDVFLFLQHPSVFTLGRRGGSENLLVSKAFLEKLKIQIVPVERGGDITFHGPGQLVVYPIINLQAAGIKIVDYVGALEEVMIRTVRNFDIAARRNPINRGIWVGACKLGSIGIAIRRGVSFHGLALNVNLDLTPFSWIRPCGLQGVAMTSMQQVLGRRLPMDQVQEALKNHFETVFKIKFTVRSLQDLQTPLKK